MVSEPTSSGVAAAGGERCDVCKGIVSEVRTVCGNCMAGVDNDPQEALRQQTDMLGTMYKRQYFLSRYLGGSSGWAMYPKAGPVDARIHAICTAMSHEVHELDRLTNWKWWKKANVMDEDAAREELVDILHFWLQCAIELGMTPEQITAQYMAKSAVNIERQKNGY